MNQILVIKYIVVSIVEKYITKKYIIISQKEGVFMKNEIKEYKEYIKQQAADPNTQWTEHESVWETLHEQYDV